LIFENLIRTDDGLAMYPCESCGGMHQDQDKGKMFVNGLWSEPVTGSDGSMESFTSSAMYLPYGWLAWADLMAEHEEAQKQFDAGNDAMMIVFYNTRLARTWKRSIQVIDYNALVERAEHYQLRLAPDKVLFTTAFADTQDNRLAVQVIGWGRDLRAWVLDYIELPGDPANDHVWDTLTEYINAGIRHESGCTLQIVATGIDTGGHRTHAVRHYVRENRIRNPIACFGSTSINAPALKKGNAVDVIYKGISKKKILVQYSIGTIDLKHDLMSKLQNDAEKDLDDRMIRFSKELPPEYFSGILSETYDRKTKRFIPKTGIRNEPLDTLIGNYAILHHPSIRAHRYTAKDWDAMTKNNQTVVTPGKISLANWGRG
jgi:phage terminase large subunit GpA-like protein